ncbi:MAG: DUF2927 domain-containing protein [Marinovum sp.]|nr:DUF2927 domain-containing protein [Marinovum sp.]
MRRILLPFYLMLSACMPITPGDIPSRAATFETTLPPMKTFTTPRPMVARKANADIMRDFLDLSFRLESGRTLPRFSRFEEPISVKVTGKPPSTLGRDLNRLLHRMRTEAGLDITLRQDISTANVTIEAVTRAEIRQLLPQAACFVVPNVSSLDEYRSLRRSPKLNWANIAKRSRVSIFVPNDSSPQEVRDCLHEELAQSVGPLNDLYRLSNSVFNDDNVHTVLTGYDMLILRATYDPSLHAGMSMRQVADRLPGILSRINPTGDFRARQRNTRTPRPWIESLQTALGPGARPAQRRRAADEALKISKAMGWQDHRHGFAHYAMGRILQATNPRAGRAEFETAQAYFKSRPGLELHQAYAASQLAAYALTENDPETVLRLVTPAQSVAARYENAALLATLMLLRAEALDLAGRVSEANRVRMDSLGWARYGFGADWAVRAKMRDIARLSPLKGSRG